MEPQGNRRYLTIGEVAARLRVGHRTVRWLIRTQQLSAQRIFSPPPQWGGGRTGWT
jgi:orotate phosphoribosyltransferase-like protein